MSRFTSRQAALLFAAYPHRDRIYGGEGRDYRYKPANLPFLQERVEQYLESNARKTLWPCSVQKLCVKIYDTDRRL